MDYYRSEIKTGIMAVVCIALLVLATFCVGGASMVGTAYNLNIVYPNVGGLEVNAPVYFAGLQAGIVKKISIADKETRDTFPGTSIIATISVNNNAVVKTDSKIIIKTMGFMGVKYIDITPGTDTAEAVKEDTTIKGTVTQDMNDVIDSVGYIIDQIKPRAGSIVNGIDGIVGENGTLQETIIDLKKLLKDADELIVVNKEDLNKMISNLSAASEHLKGFAADIEAHPWKLLIKTSDKSAKKKETKPEEKNTNKQNFGAKKK
jgi:phospholipid/cholesterol/gamma-HCH transport system substrate-binding protein